MGINDSGLRLLEWVFQRYPVKSVLDLGAQVFYQSYGTAIYGSYADTYYRLKGVERYRCIDLNGENGALRLDLSVPQQLEPSDLVTDFGTSEHVGAYTREDEVFAVDALNDTWVQSEGHRAGIEALYNCWTTKYTSSSLLIVSANPATGHWKDHGHFYYTKTFYDVLCELTGMKVCILDELYAMGNTTSGKEICCVLDVRGSHWISLAEFTKAFEHIFPT